MKGTVYTMSGSQTQGRAGAFVFNYSDKKHSIQSHNATHFKRIDVATKRHMVCSRVPLSKGNRLKETVTSVSVLLPAPRVSGPALVSLYHTLLITAMTRPLSQRMQSSFSGATCLPAAPSRLCVSILGRQSDSSASSS